MVSVPSLRAPLVPNLVYKPDVCGCVIRLYFKNRKLYIMLIIEDPTSIKDFKKCRQHVIVIVTYGL